MRARRAAFEAVVHEDEGRAAVVEGVLDQIAPAPAGPRVGVLDFSYGEKSFNGVLVTPPPRSSARHTVCSAVKASASFNLGFQFGHAAPGVEDVRHALAAQACEVIAAEVFPGLRISTE